MDYTFFANLLQEFALPENGVLSRVLHKDDKVNVTHTWPQGPTVNGN